MHLLIPLHWESTWFGNSQLWKNKEEHSGNFHIHPLPTTSNHVWGRYFFLSTNARLYDIQPDIIYIIHEERVWVHHQIYLYRKLWSPHAKIIFFSMNAKGVPNRHFLHRLMWKNVRRQTDAALVHYPGCMESLRAGGYEKPIFLQTQIGVDEEKFRPDETLREQQRRKLGLENDFVVGFAGRLVEDKGVDDLLAILPLAGTNWKLLLVGGGPLRGEIEKLQKHSEWGHRIVTPGQVALAQMPDLFRCMDCFFLGSKTMPHWIDTFPLVTVQAQACSVPVVAADSGAIPWQLDRTALFYPEGNRPLLKECIETIRENPEIRQDLAQRGMERSRKLFCIGSMTDHFHQIIEQVATGSYHYHSKGETYSQSKAYKA